mmetsp:Transcript_11383/g.25080  ORF Transcript_11383/g.25080 Transcript_11383/m.25080 type:complete len:205 (+) Transcript_11383:1650-2264(+)
MAFHNRLVKFNCRNNTTCSLVKPGKVEGDTYGGCVTKPSVAFLHRDRRLSLVESNNRLEVNMKSAFSSLCNILYRCFNVISTKSNAVSCFKSKRFHIGPTTCHNQFRSLLICCLHNDVSHFIIPKQIVVLMLHNHLFSIVFGRSLPCIWAILKCLQSLSVHLKCLIVILRLVTQHTHVCENICRNNLLLCLQQSNSFAIPVKRQ